MLLYSAINKDLFLYKSFGTSKHKTPKWNENMLFSSKLYVQEIIVTAYPTISWKGGGVKPDVDIMLPFYWFHKRILVTYASQGLFACMFYFMFYSLITWTINRSIKMYFSLLLSIAVFDESFGISLQGIENNHVTGRSFNWIKHCRLFGD